MKPVLRALLILCCIVFIGILAQAVLIDNGNVSIAWQNTTIETSVVLLITTFVLVGVMMFYVGSLIEWVVELPRNIRKQNNIKQTKGLLDELEQFTQRLVVEDFSDLKKLKFNKLPENIKREYQLLSSLVGWWPDDESVQDDIFLHNYIGLEESISAKNWPVAVMHAEILLDINPQSLLVWRYMAEAEHQQNHNLAAYEIMQNGLKHKVDFPAHLEQIYVAAAQDMQKNDDTAQARKILKAGQKHYPNSAPIHDALKALKT